MPFPLALAALSSMQGGGGLSGASQPPSGPVTSSTGAVNVGGLDFGGARESVPYTAIAIGVGAVLLALSLGSRRRS